MKKHQRLLALILSLMMVFQMMPTSAFAARGREQSNPVTDAVILKAAPRKAAANPGMIDVTLVADDGNTTQAKIPTGKVADVAKPGWEGYTYVGPVTVENLLVYEFAIDNENHAYFSTAEDQFAAIELGSKEVTIAYQAQDPIPVEYQVVIDDEKYDKTNNFFDITGPDVARVGGTLTANIVKQSGVNFLNDGWTVKIGDQTVAADENGNYTASEIQQTDGKIVVRIEGTKKNDSQSLSFEGSNFNFYIPYSLGSNQSGYSGEDNQQYYYFSKGANIISTVNYTPAHSFTVNITEYHQYNNGENDSPDINKDLNKVNISIGDVVPLTKLDIPRPDPNGDPITTDLGNGYTATLTCTGNTHPWENYRLTITAKEDRIIYGTINLSINFKDIGSKEVWASEFIGIEKLYANIYDTKYYWYENEWKNGRQGTIIKGGWFQNEENADENYLTTTGKVFVQRDGTTKDGTNTVDLYGPILEGYSKDLSDYEVILKEDGIDHYLTRSDKNTNSWCQITGDGYIHIYIPWSDQSDDIRITIRATRRYQVVYDLNKGNWGTSGTPNASDFMTTAKGLKPGTTIQLINKNFTPVREGFEFEGWELERTSLTGYMYGTGDAGETFTITSGDPETDLPVTYNRAENVYQFKLKAVWAGEKSDQTAPYNVVIEFYDANNTKYSTSFKENGLKNQRAYVLMSSLQEKITKLIDEDKINFGDLKNTVKDIWPDFFTDDPDNKYSVYIKEDESSELKLTYRAAEPTLIVPNKTLPYNGTEQKISSDGITYDDFEVEIGSRTYIVSGLKSNQEVKGTDVDTYKPTDFDTSSITIKTKTDNPNDAVDVTNLIKPSFTGGQLEITKATLIIKADNDSKHSGENDPTFSGYSISGLLGKDEGKGKEDVIQTPPTITRSDASDNNTGTHSGVLAPAKAELKSDYAKNYNITYENGDFTITDVSYSTLTLTETITNAASIGDEAPTFRFEITGVSSFGTLPAGIVATPKDGTTDTYILSNVPVGASTLQLVWAENANPTIKQLTYSIPGSDTDKEITSNDAKYRRAVNQDEVQTITITNGNGTVEYKDTRYAPYRVYSIIGNPDKNDTTFTIGQKEFSVNDRQDSIVHWGIVGDAAILINSDKNIQAGTNMTYGNDYKFAYLPQLSTESENHITGTDRAEDISLSNIINIDGKTIIYAVYAQKPTITYNMVIDNADFDASDRGTFSDGRDTMGNNSNYVKRSGDSRVLYDYTNNSKDEQLWSSLEIGTGNHAYNTYQITDLVPHDNLTNRANGGAYTFIGWKDLATGKNWKATAAEEPRTTLYTTEGDKAYQFRGQDHGIWAMWARTLAKGETTTYDGQKHPGSGDIDWGEGQTEGWLNGKPQTATFTYTKKQLKDGSTTEYEYVTFATAAAHLVDGKYVIDDNQTAPVDVGEYKLVVTAVANGTTVTSQPADIVINPKPVTITTATESKFGDANTVLENHNVTEVGFIEADQNKVTWNVTGQQTGIGTSTNTIGQKQGEDYTNTYTNANGVNLANYSITYFEGTLTVYGLTKTDSTQTEAEGTTHNIGDEITYTITVSNPSDAVAKDIEVDESSFLSSRTATITAAADGNTKAPVVEDDKKVTLEELDAGKNLIVTVKYNLVEADFTTSPANTVTVKLKDGRDETVTGTAADSPNVGAKTISVKLIKKLDWYEEAKRPEGSGFYDYADEYFQFKITGVKTSNLTEGTNSTANDVRATNKVTITDNNDDTVTVKGVHAGEVYALTVEGLIPTGDTVTVTELNTYDFVSGHKAQIYNGTDIEAGSDASLLKAVDNSKGKQTGSVDEGLITYEITNEYKPVEFVIRKQVDNTEAKLPDNDYKNDTFHYIVNYAADMGRADQSVAAYRSNNQLGNRNSNYAIPQADDSGVEIESDGFGALYIYNIPQDTDVKITGATINEIWDYHETFNEIDGYWGKKEANGTFNRNGGGFGPYQKYRLVNKYTSVQDNKRHSKDQGIKTGTPGNGLDVTMPSDQSLMVTFTNVTNPKYTVKYWVGEGNDLNSYTEVPNASYSGYAQPGYNVAIFQRTAVGDVDGTFAFEAGTGFAYTYKTANFVTEAGQSDLGTFAEHSTVNKDGQEGVYDGDDRIDYGTYPLSGPITANYIKKTISPNEVINIYFEKVKMKVDKKHDTTGGEPELKEGQTISYTITVENNSNLPVKNFEIVDWNADFDETQSNASMSGISYTVIKNEGSNDDGSQKDGLNHIVKITSALAAGASITLTAKHTLTGQEAAMGEFTNTATVYVGNTPVDHYTDKLGPDFVLDKKVSKDGKNFADSVNVSLGDTLTYQVTLTNKGNVALTFTKANLTDMLKTSTSSEIAEDTDGVESELPTLAGQSEDSYTLPVNGTLTFTYTKEVTGNTRTYQNKATAKTTVTVPNEDYDPDQGEGEGNSKTTEQEIEKSDTATVTVKDTPGIDVTKTLATVNGTPYATGAVKANDVLVYNVVVKNTGNTTLENIEVKDKVAGAVLVTPLASGISADTDNKVATIASLAPEAEVTVKYTYTVTEEDAKAEKKFENTAVANVPEGPSDEDKTETDVASISIEKEVENKKTSYALNDRIEYKVVVKNTGTVALSEVKVEDDHYGTFVTSTDNSITGLPATIANLAVGAEVTIQYTYTVTESDLGGSITNKAK
ncbi:MAG: hypothetical protein IJ153_00005, partial [Clostridia bacterium]|nr:hypothetical protein [Clostridia bacterium]